MTAPEEPPPDEVEDELAQALAETEGVDGGEISLEEGVEGGEIPLEDGMEAGEGLQELDEGLDPDAGEPAGEVGEDEEAVGEDDNDEHDEHEEDDQEKLQETIEGSLRLKRLLSRDDDEEIGGKKRKLVGEELANDIAIRALLNRWGLSTDQVTRHVLEQCASQEVKDLSTSSYVPDKFNAYKSAAELFAKYMGEMRERKMVGSMSVDVIASFKFRWKLDMTQDKMLRGLTHKELRYIFNHYDGSAPLTEFIEAAKSADPDEEESATLSAVPDGAGVGTVARFNRLELIDPLADCAVFGDANLTFALKLAKHRKGLGHVGRVIATTFEEIDTLRERYKEIDDSIAILEDHYAEVYHGVDCTRIGVDPRFKGMESSLGAVYYNFPHSGAIQGFFDGHPIVNWRHENLMRLFFRALRQVVKPGGIVKVSSNAGAVGVRYSYIVDSAITNEFLHVETMPFLEWHLHRYGRSYGDKRDVYKRPDEKNNQSYNAQRADADMVYCFCYAPTGRELDAQMVRLPPTLSTISSCCDGPFKNLQGTGKKNLANQLHKRFITEVSGTHVG